MANSTPAIAGRRSRLQFSLRLLLVGLTAFAVGFPIWYRWPFEEVVYRYPGGDSTKPPMGSSLKTWRRTWGGGKVQSGRAVSETQFRGRTTGRTVEHFHEGQLHGPAAAYYEERPLYLGQYEHGQREGIWTRYDSEGNRSVTAHWHQGRLDGLYELVDNDGRKRRYEYCRGRLISADGNPVENRLLRQWYSGTIDDPRIAEELNALIPFVSGYGSFFVETPLKDALFYLQDQHDIPIILDTRRAMEIDRPTTLDIQGNDLWSALTLLTRYHQLDLDYRYGALYVTTVEHVRDRYDRTGVSDIRPPAGSALARAWKELCPIEFVETSLGDAAEFLADQTGVRFDISGLPIEMQATRVTMYLKHLPLRHVLGIALDRYNLRAEARGGDTVAILPPEAFP